MEYRRCAGSGVFSDSDNSDKERKMRILLLMICATLMISRGYNEKKTDLQEANLKGRVKSVREIPYDAVEKFGKVEKGSMRGFSYDNAYVLYNEQGNIVERNGYNADGSLEYKLTYQYDNKGNIVEENWYDPYVSLDSKWTYQYDNKGNKVEENGYNADGSLDFKSTYQYEYDSKDNWTQKKEYKNNKPNEITERKIEYYK